MQRQPLSLKLAMLFASFALPFSFALVAVKAIAQDEDPFLKGDALQAEILKSCADGCVTFNRQEADTFQGQLESLIARKQAEAFQAGIQAQKAACASLI